MNIIQLSILAAGILATSTASAMVIYEFDTAGEFTTNFTTLQTTGVAQTANGGLNDTGSVNLAPLNETVEQLFVLNTPFAGNLTSWEASFYLYGNPRNANAGDILGFGFFSEPSANYSELGAPTNNSILYFSAIYMQVGPVDGGSIGLESINDNTSTNFLNVSETTPDLPDIDAWYRYTIEVDYLGGNDYSVTGSLDSANADGSLGITYGTETATFSNPNLAADPTVYLYFSAWNGVSLDRFSTTAIPEPSGVLLAGLGLGGLLLRRRRLAKA